MKNEDRGYKVPDEIRELVSLSDKEERDSAIIARIDRQMAILEY